MEQHNEHATALRELSEEFLTRARIAACIAGAEALEQNARLREALKKAQVELSQSRWRFDCDHSRHTCEEIGCNGQYLQRCEDVLAAALSPAPLPEPPK